MVHIRMTTGVIRRVEPSAMDRAMGRGACYYGALTASWGGGRDVHYFPNYNFTLGRPEAARMEEFGGHKILRGGRIF